MDQTIIIRSSHAGVSMCLRLIRYSFEKCLTRGTRQYLPRRICQREFIPQFHGKSKFGACCSSTLHTYMMMYRSRLLSRELFFCQISLVHCSLSDQAIRISVTILLKQPWSLFLLNGDGTFRMAIVATHTARMVSIEDA